ncbi:AMIN domain-containing protein [Helicobacter sp. MIT 21-1697]|uniref:AMIN domain-containing protein n=1 Tax=Helicobacter sp. MIT 21-1697 TaxID=2993733 RepID=UPI00224A9B50|nr:AMIN domain-containing protein [Helicobacter sp. MIT 21-1697]MCX2716235.1 AMIN domain-containing protein [Helicobacter sp. MIT 21-1697]
MKKKILVWVLLSVWLCVNTLGARENPFKSVITPKLEEHQAPSIHQDPLSSVEFVLPSTARVLKSVQVTYQNLDGSIESKTIQLDESVDWHYPLLIAQKAQGATYNAENRFKLGEFELIINKSSLFIATRKKLLRDFILPKPYRLMLDIEGVKSNESQKIKIGKKYFSDAEISTHEGFYRISIGFDGRYKPVITPQRDGFVIALE